MSNSQLNMVESPYRPEIDGLRAVAVLAVVLFHAGLGISGGYVGVDVFFVISGFLITGIILRGIEDDTFCLAGFWERRIRRIFPVLFVTVAVTLGLGYWLLIPGELEELGKSSIAQTAILANVYFWRDTGYFAGPAELKPLLHTWSLAVEEQFYLFFPLLLVVFRTHSRRKLFWGLMIIAGMSFAGSLYGTHFHPSATFFLLPTRAWELLAGCLLAFRRSPSVSRPRWDEALGLAGLAAILLPACLYDNQTPFPGLAAVPPVAGTAAILYATAATPHTIVGRLLSLRPVVFIGIISYSMYLWHWPAIVYMRHYFTHFGGKQATLALICTLFCAVASWKYVEQPFRRKTFFQSRRRVFATAFSISGAVAAISVFFVATHGVPERFTANLEAVFEDPQWFGSQEYSLPTVERFRIQDMPSLGTDSMEVSHTKLDFLVWGDSHALVLCQVIDQVGHEVGLSGRVVASGGYVPGPNLLYKHNPSGVSAALLESMATNPPRNLVLINRWSGRTNGKNEVELKSLGIAQSQKDYLSCDTDNHESMSFEDSSEVLLRALQKLALFCEQNGIRLWILKQVPEINEPSPALDLCQYYQGIRTTLPNQRASTKQHLLRQSRPEQIFAKINSPAVRILDPAPFLFDQEGWTINYFEGRSCYRDDDHLTRWGAELLKPLFTEMFTEMKLRKYRVAEETPSSPLMTR